MSARLSQTPATHTVVVQVFIFFPDEPKVGVKTIKTYAERMRNEGVFRAIMVTQVALSRGALHARHLRACPSVPPLSA